MMPKVEATKTSKILSIRQDFPEEFMIFLNAKLDCNLCTCMFFATNAFILKVIEISPNTKKPQAPDLNH